MTGKKGLAKSTQDIVLEQSQAQRIVGDALIREAFEELKDGYLRLWSHTKPDEAAKRELAYVHFKAVADVWSLIERKAQGAHVRALKEAAEKQNG